MHAMRRRGDFAFFDKLWELSYYIFNPKTLEKTLLIHSKHPFLQQQGPTAEISL